MKKVLTYLLIWLLAWGLNGCASIGFKPTIVSGQVLEEETGRPIPAAVVMALWLGTSSSLLSVHSTTICYHFDSALTDAQGRFSFSPSEKEQSYVDGDHGIVVQVFKRGYKNARLNQPSGETRYYLTEDKARGKERIKYLERLWTGTGCGHAPRGYNKFLIDALLEEVRSLATDEDDFQLIRAMERMRQGDPRVKNWP